MFYIDIFVYSLEGFKLKFVIKLRNKCLVLFSLLDISALF